ncbi:hypothetical protein ACLB1N_37010 [Escherichia coli]
MSFRTWSYRPENASSRTTDRADRPRIDAWQTLVNHHYGLHDPNAPTAGR